MAENVEWKWRYERLKEDGYVETIYDAKNDTDAKITGHIVINVKAWFDENPAERIRLGWTKHLYLDLDDVKKVVEYNPQTQFYTTSTEQVDEYTIRNVYHVIDKSEDQLAFEEMLGVAENYGVVSGFTFY